jgi:hypothetical protein
MSGSKNKEENGDESEDESGVKQRRGEVKSESVWKKETKKKGLKCHHKYKVKY